MNFTSNDVFHAFFFFVFSLFSSFIFCIRFSFFADFYFLIHLRPFVSFGKMIIFHKLSIFWTSNIITFLMEKFPSVELWLINCFEDFKKTIILIFLLFSSSILKQFVRLIEWRGKKIHLSLWIDANRLFFIFLSSFQRIDNTNFQINCESNPVQ